MKQNLIHRGRPEMSSTPRNYEGDRGVRARSERPLVVCCPLRQLRECLAVARRSRNVSRRTPRRNDRAARGPVRVVNERNLSAQDRGFPDRDVAARR
ncbi:hypothetical protein EVAR_52229_1 [Eumeta japonica]|uniref:Uncharacterized protein n=1 Tax=Eumeta variegata TaxID=151549 RepID=A0A4C1Z5Y9_EUMVA|nr:hypothetical protein EVAR_52229_1 [Eumeta japonica]